MGENSKVEWCHHSFNPWRGCTKISAGCANCYAEKQSARNPATLGVWGDNGTRVIASESMWKQPLKWNSAAEQAGERHRVFCASMADVFEDRPELIEPRKQLFKLIEQTPALDWLLLTKRPENVLRLQAFKWELFGWPKNVWLGTSVENQEQADKRIPELLKVPAAVRFLSMEPLLETTELYKWMIGDGHDNPFMPGIHWVIVGGESGPNARPMHPQWARSLRDQCTAAGVPVFFKQWGEYSRPDDLNTGLTEHGGKYVRGIHYVNLDGTNGAISLQSDGFGYPSPDNESWSWDCAQGQRSDVKPGAVFVQRVGKSNAGRLLDGREWSEFPK